MHARLRLAPRFEIAVSLHMKTLHQLRLSWSRAVSLAFALLCLVGSSGSAHAASAGPPSWPATAPRVTSQFAIADYDGDRRPDLAIVQAGQIGSSDTRYLIGFQLSTGQRQTIGITAPAGGLQITSRDVNGDNFLDVIVTTAWTNRPVAILLNDGQGNFRASSPSAFPGAFTTSKKSCASTTAESKDSTAILLSRYPTGNCPDDSRFSSPRNVTGPVVLRASHNLFSFGVVSFLGRAPPSFIFHF
jgi:hypothetical protein